MKKRRDLKILWNSNSPHSASGYGIATRDIVYRLAEDGWKIAISAFYGVDGGPVNIAYPDSLNPRLKGLTVKHYPRMSEPYGSDGMFFHGQDWGANVVFGMQDAWVLDPAYLSRIPAWIPYAPIDKEPLPMNVVDKLRYAYKVMCFSKFGERLLLEKGFFPHFITEGADTEIFKPKSQADARNKLAIPQDCFLFLMVGANKENPPRKGFQEALEAFKLFHDKHPEARLMFHIQQRAPTGFPIQQYADYLGILKYTIFAPDYRSMFLATSDFIAEEYNAADALLHPSQTEGFGLCTIEAQACGKPVIVQNCQSMPELIIEGKTGFAASTLYKRYTPDLSFTNVADPKSVYECMEKTYEMVKSNPNKVKNDCRNWIVDNFDIDTLVKEKWIPFLCDLQDELLPLTSDPKSNKVELPK